MSTNELSITQENVEIITLTLLQSADKGKGPGPKKLNSYQIAARFPPNIVQAFVAANMFGGVGVGRRNNCQPLTMRVKNACKSLAGKGLVSIDYQDTRGLLIEVTGTVCVRPSYGVCGLYQYIGK